MWKRGKGKTGMTPKQEARLYGRAIKSRWPVSDEVKVDVVETLWGIATMGEKESARVAACNSLMAAESQNQRDEHKVVDIGIQERNAGLDAIATDLGIAPDLIVDAQAESGGVDSSSEVEDD